jgi:hypothetical protein
MSIYLQKSDRLFRYPFCYLSAMLGTYGVKCFQMYFGNPSYTFIRGEGLIPRPSGAVIKVLNPRPNTLLEQRYPVRSAAGFVIIGFWLKM